MTDLSLTCTRLIAAPVERVFNAWLTPGLMARFMVIGPGMTVTDAHIDARVGGRFGFNVNMDGKASPHAGTYLGITPHSRLQFTWESPYAAPGSTVSVEFAGQPGGTMVTLTHLLFNSEGSRDGHNRGWTAILERLAGVVG